MGVESWEKIVKGEEWGGGEWGLGVGIGSVDREWGLGVGSWELGAGEWGV